MYCIHTYIYMYMYIHICIYILYNYIYVCVCACICIVYQVAPGGECMFRSKYWHRSQEQVVRAEGPALPVAQGS